MTVQVGDEVIYEGKEPLLMCNWPFLPKDHPCIKERTDQEIEEAGMSGIDEISSNWRGYIGTWEVNDGRLFLIKLDGCYKLDSDKPLFADWFTGFLGIPKGEIIHWGYNAIFEQELYVKIENGIVTDTKVIDNRGQQFDGGSAGWSYLYELEDELYGEDDS
jgi:hypothetical protein